MKKILIGMIKDGQAGGVDRYILDFFHNMRMKATIDFLSNDNDSQLYQEAEKNGFSLHSVSGLSNPFLQYSQAKKLIAKNHYDIVYMNISTALAFPVLKAAYDAGVKRVIAHSHSSGYDCASFMKRRLMTFLHTLCKPLVCKYATDYLTCSDKAAAWMFTKKTLDNKSVRTVQNTVDTSVFRFDPKKRYEIRKKLGVEDNFVIGNVGNMVYQKNQLFLIDVFSKIAEADDSAVLVIIGDGELRGEIENRIKRYSLSNKVRLLGRVNASNGYMSAFDVFALPSHFEGMPIVSVEAQCSSLPCVFSGKITRQADISNACKFVAIRSASAWAEAINEFKKYDRTKIRLTKELDVLSSKKQSGTLDWILEE